MAWGFKWRGAAKTGQNPLDKVQPCHIEGHGWYMMSYRRACQVAAMPARQRKTWLGRNWRVARPLDRQLDGSFLFRSGTHPSPPPAR